MLQKQSRGIFAIETRDIFRGSMRGKVFGGRHPYRRAGVFMQPRGASDMVGMVVRDDDAFDRLALHGFAEVPLPQYVRFRHAIAGVDNGPAWSRIVVIFEQPEVDMVERERQGHTNPENPVGDADRFAVGGRCFVGVGNHGVREVGSGRIPSGTIRNTRWIVDDFATLY